MAALAVRRTDQRRYACPLRVDWNASPTASSAKRTRVGRCWRDDSTRALHTPFTVVSIGFAGRAASITLKGGSTVVAAPDSRSWTYRDGRVGLATSGSGDTLAGIVAGLLARGAQPHEAAVWGVYLHGEAGNRLGRQRGPIGVPARELLAEVPAVRPRP